MTRVFRPPWLAVATACVLLSAGTSCPAGAVLIFDNLSAGSLLATGERTGSQDYLTYITTVATNTTISNIAIYDSINPKAGDITFIIYNDTTGKTVYTSAPQSFAADASSTSYSWKESSTFSYTLQAGDQYFIGGVVNVDNYQPELEVKAPSKTIDWTQNGITSDGKSGLFNTSGGLVSENASTGFSIPVELFSPPASPSPLTVPEPSTLAGGGLAAVLGVAFALRKKWSRTPAAV